MSFFCFMDYQNMLKYTNKVNAKIEQKQRNFYKTKKMKKM